MAGLEPARAFYGPTDFNNNGTSRHSAARTHCGAELQGIRVAGLH
jgi:hypothetical protein